VKQQKLFYFLLLTSCRPHRLGRSRTPGFQPGNRGSNPLGAILPFANILPASYFRLDLRQPNIDTPFFPPVFCILCFFSSFSHPFTLPVVAGIGFELALFFTPPQTGKYHILSYYQRTYANPACFKIGFVLSNHYCLLSTVYCLLSSVVVIGFVLHNSYLVKREGDPLCGNTSVSRKLNHCLFTFLTFLTFSLCRR
jgi:hypothetical protein